MFFYEALNKIDKILEDIFCMIRLLRLTFMLLMTFLPAGVFAEDSDTTISIEVPQNEITLDLAENTQGFDYLSFASLFGTMGSGLICIGDGCENQQVIGELFRLFNISLATIGVAFLGYIVTMSAFNTAASGQFFTQQFSSLTVPIRSVLGITFLLPNQFGYSILQQAVMSVALMGSTLGTVLYNQVGFYYDNSSVFATVKKQSTAIIGQVTIQEAETEARTVINTLAKLISIKLYDNNIGRPDSPGSYSFSLPKQFSSSNSSDISYRIYFQYNSQDIEQVYLEFSGGDNPKSDADNAAALIANLELILSTVFDKDLFDSDSIDKDYVDLLTPFVVSELISIEQLLVSQYTNPGVIVPKPGYQFERKSWIFLPNDFFKMLGSEIFDENNIRSETKNFNVASGLESGGLSYLIDNTIFQQTFLKINDKIDGQFSLGYATTNSVDQNTNSAAINAFEGDTGGLISDKVVVTSKAVDLARFIGEAPNNSAYMLFYDAVGGIISKLSLGQQANEQPITLLMEYGIDKLNIVLNAMYILLASFAVSAGFLPIASAYFAGGTLTAISAFFGVLFAVLSLFLTNIPVIITCVFIVPMTPLLIYTSAVLSWYIQVVSSIIAAPIISLGLISPGKGLGRASPALNLIINLFLRPGLTVLGFFAGLILFNLLVPLFTEMMLRFMLVMTSMRDNSFYNLASNGLLSLGVAIVFEYAYIFMLIGLISRCFNLIYDLPDQVLVWIGGTPLPFGSDGNQTLSQVRQSVEQTAKALPDQMTKPLAGFVQTVKQTSSDKISKENVIRARYLEQERTRADGQNNASGNDGGDIVNPPSGEAGDDGNPGGAVGDNHGADDADRVSGDPDRGLDDSDRER